MKLISTSFVLVNFALVSVADGSRIEANHGEDVTLSFTMDKVEEADGLRISFTSETTKNTYLIARRCTGSERCDAVDTHGVKLLVGGGGRVSVTLQKVNSSRSGLYKARAFFGKDVCERNVTLVVNEALFSSTTAPPHSSTPKTFNSSNLLWLCALIPLVIVILGGVYFWRRRRILCFKKRDLESNSSDCAEVYMNGHRENAEALLTDH